MAKKTIDQLDVKGRRIFIRADFNVPQDDKGRITDDRRIQATLPTIRSVLARGGSVVAASHLGRPEGSGHEADYSMAPVVERLRELLGNDAVSVRLVGKLRCRAYCIRPGRYFLRRLINAAGCLRHLDTLVPLGPAFHADLAMWRELMEDPELQASSYRTPLYNHLRRTPEVLVVGDAMAESGGGFVCGMGLDVAAWWKVSWPQDVVDRFHRTSQRLESHVNMITIAHLELATLVLGLATMTELLPACEGRAVLALADNTNPVSWARRAGAQDWRAAALVRLIGTMEARQRFSLAAKHIEGVKNEEADFISRHGEEEVAAYLADRPVPFLACMSSPPRMWSQVPPSSAYTQRVMAI
jgi:hypothetical protein